MIREITKKWNKEKFGNIHAKIEKAEKVQADADLLNKGDDLKLEIKEELEKLYKIKASMLCQTARVNWQLQGEKNSKFFHKAIACRRKSNTIMGVQIENDWITKPSLIKESFFNHFYDFLTSQEKEQIFKLPR